MRHLVYSLVALLTLTAAGRADPTRFRFEWTGFSHSYTPPHIALTGGGSGFEIDHPSFAMAFHLTSEPVEILSGERWPLPLGFATVTRLPETSPLRFVESLQLTGRFTDLESGAQMEVKERFGITGFYMNGFILNTGDGGGVVHGTDGREYEYGAYLRLDALGETAMSADVGVDVGGIRLPEMPEPSTLTLLGLGGLGLLAWRRRRTAATP